MRYIAALLCLSLPAFGAIGEKESQIEHRYGHTLGVVQEKLPRGVVKKAYHVGDLDIFIIYINGLSEAELFQDANCDLLGETCEPLTDDQVAEFLTVNSGGGEWRRVDFGAPDANHQWEVELERANCYATLSLGGDSLIVLSQRFLNAFPP